MHTLTITTSKKKEVVDITDRVREALPPGFSGVCHLFTHHTTTAITAADLDPGTDLDMLDALYGMLPNVQFRHPHNPDHAPDHVLAAIIGPSMCVPVRNQRIQLGAWQRLVLFDFDGPRERQVTVTLIAE